MTPLRYLIVPLFAVVACAVSATSAPGATYEWDFRNGHFDNLSLVPMGSGAVTLLVPTREGLRMALPAGYDVKALGFSPRFTLRGDFEVTVEFTILSRTLPKSGHGTGPSIYLSTGSTQDPAASIGRLLRPDGRDIHGLFAARIDDGKRVPTARLINVADSKVMSGRLQLKRSQGEITYSAGEGRNAPLRPLATLSMGEGEVTMLRIGVSQSDPQSSAVVVLHNVRIEAAELPHIPSESSRTAQLYRPRYQPPPALSSRRWLWQALAALGLAVAAGSWWWKRSSNI
ncbi:MAG: DUF1583 domain-containing protein [Planctomycetaceae bacterium]|nr:DUF1583 domain-containing protein [Planctomycetaceae bacterium]